MKKEHANNIENHCSIYIQNERYPNAPTVKNTNGTLSKDALLSGGEDSASSATASISPESMLAASCAASVVIVDASVLLEDSVMGGNTSKMAHTKKNLLLPHTQ